MSKIEIKVEGINKRDIQITLKELAEAFGVTLEIDLAKVIADAEMGALFDLVAARFDEQGFTLTADPKGEDRPAKRGRKPKVSTEEAREALASSESLEESKPGYSDEELSALKAATLARIGKHWQDDAGRGAMQGILKTMCGGAGLFRDTDASLFPAISDAIDAYENG